MNITLEETLDPLDTSITLWILRGYILIGHITQNDTIFILSAMMYTIIHIV